MLLDPMIALLGGHNITKSEVHVVTWKNDHNRTFNWGRGAVYHGFTFMNFTCVLVDLHVYIMWIDKKVWCE